MRCGNDRNNKRRVKTGYGERPGDGGEKTRTMELELDICLIPWGPWTRAACTPSLFAGGERRFVEEEAGPGLIWLERLMAGWWDGIEKRVERKRSPAQRSR